MILEEEIRNKKLPIAKEWPKIQVIFFSFAIYF
jgi:hypothetical protein